MEDKHLNLFWHYGSAKTDEKVSKEELERIQEKEKTVNALENNITRSTLLTFKSLNSKNKAKFLNRLIAKSVLDENVEYTFEYELQSQSFKGILKKINIEDKYLVGFCPSGSVDNKNIKGSSIDIDEIIELVDSCPIIGGSNPDGCILAKKNNDIVLAVAFENKKEDLNPEQLRRHLKEYLNVETAKGHLIIKSYNDFFGLLKACAAKDKNSYCDDLLTYLNYLSLYTPSFADIAKSYDLAKPQDGSSDEQYQKVCREMRNITNGFLGKLLEEVNNKYHLGKIRIQKGWGSIIDIKKMYKYLNMIGLVWHSDKEEAYIELNIKFAANMKQSRRFYKKFGTEMIKKNKNLFMTHFVFVGQYGKYNDKAEWHFGNVVKYYDFFRKKIENNDFHQIGEGEVESLLKEMNDKIEEFDYKSILNTVKYTKNHDLTTAYKNHKLSYVPSIQIVKRWGVRELEKINKQKFLNQIYQTMDQAMQFFG